VPSRHSLENNHEKDVPASEQQRGLERCSMTGKNGSNASKPLAGEVTLYQKPTYTVVKFLLQNPRDNPVLVTMRQTMPEEVTESQVTFAEEYNGDAWEYDEGALTFKRQLAGEELIETAYGTRDISLETLQQRIRVSTITVTDETGAQLGTVTGLQPTVAERRDEKEQSDTRSEDTQEFESGESDIEAEQDKAEKAETDDGEGDDGESGDKITVGNAHEHESEEINEQETEDKANKGDSDEQQMEEEQADSKESDEPDQTDDPEVTADLPANRSDYILEDVKDRIESADEFDWQPVSETSERSSGIIGWVKSVFGR